MKTENESIKIEINEENYFDIAEASHAVMTLWHDGKYGYVILCKSQFRPGPVWRESNVENENDYFHIIESMVVDGMGKFKGYDEIDNLIDELNEFIENLEMGEN
jgi:hypothetical protein